MPLCLNTALKAFTIYQHGVRVIRRHSNINEHKESIANKEMLTFGLKVIPTYAESL
jgi:hypothetical protein